MSLGSNVPSLHLPQAILESVDDVDAEALRVRNDLGWSLAAFIGVFDADLRWLCLVQLGYASERYGDAFPWCLPGGAIDVDELPSAGVIRELREETGLRVDKGELRPAAWLCRPYFRPHHRPNQAGELLLLYAAIADPDDPNVRPAPPETRAVEFALFNLDRFLAIPVRGQGDVPFQPLPRHWSWWARLAQVALEDQLQPPTCWVYESKEQLPAPPWSAPRVPAGKIDAQTAGGRPAGG